MSAFIEDPNWPGKAIGPYPTADAARHALLLLKAYGKADWSRAYVTETSFAPKATGSGGDARGR